jgi:type IV pilus assembly protein PilB
MKEQHAIFSLEEILLSYIPAEQGKRARQIAQKTHKPIIDVLLEQSRRPNLPAGFRTISEEEIAKGLAHYFRLDYEPLVDAKAKVAGIEETPELKEIIPKLAAKVSTYYRGMYMPLRFKSRPLHLGGKSTVMFDLKKERRESLYVVIALYDAYHLLGLCNYLEAIVREIGYGGIRAVFSTRQAVQAAYKQYFPDDLIITGDSDTANKRKLEEMARNEEVVQLVDNLIIQAIKSKASDIHIKCYEEEVAIKYRIDGILVPQDPIPLSKKNALIARIKILASLNILERRLPQDGRISSRKYEELNIQTLRVSTLPTQQGESIVMRLLSGQKSIRSLDKTGMDSLHLSQLKDILKEPQGILLVTGPTGSGKSSTLASILNYLNQIYNKERNIITVEDPIEYVIEGATQVAVNEKVGLTFAKVLRSVLRQDPDIVLVGEIRDLETVEIAMRAALTGHKVFSTLHTNDATSSIMRLMNMGVPQYMMAATINGIVAQRLIRRVCENCKTQVPFTEADIKSIGLSPEYLLELLQASVMPATMCKNVGCTECNQSGYSGRYPIFEIFRPNEKIRTEMLSKESSLDNNRVRKLARELTHMRTLREDGIVKIFQNITTLSEVARVSAEEAQ